MSATSEAMGRVATNLVRLARRPGRLLLLAAGAPVTIFAAFALAVGLRARTGGGWTLFVLALLLAVPIGLLAVRRERLRRHTADLPGTVLPGGVVGPAAPEGSDPRAAAVEAELGTWNEAITESQVRTARWFPRVEATQRALVQAAGGVVNAPYLRDDLRVTLLAFLGTVIALPLGVLGSFAAAFVLLLH